MPQPISCPRSRPRSRLGFAALFTPALCLTAAALLGGCSTLDVPRADNYPATGQKKARAVHHWDVLAGDVAARVAAKIALWPAGEYPLYVTVADGSSFNQGFLKLLRVRLLDRGVELSTTPTEVELQVQTQIVQHQTGVSSTPPFSLTALATGIGVARDWNEHYPDKVLRPGAATAIGLGAGLALELWDLHTRGAASGGPTRTEVLITTTLKTADRYLAGSADMYYIEGEDSVLYQPPLILTAPPPVMVPPPVQGKTWQVIKP